MFWHGPGLLAREILARHGMPRAMPGTARHGKSMARWQPVKARHAGNLPRPSLDTALNGNLSLPGLVGTSCLVIGDKQSAIDIESD